jgi:hypothetical protein
MPSLDRTKSLQELEGYDMGEPEFGSHVVTECHRLHRTPLQEFTAEDLRLMIAQDIGTDILVPIALERLREDPLVEAFYFPGDLLAAVLRADSKYWIRHSAIREEVTAIAQQAFEMERIPSKAKPAVQNAYDVFDRAEYFAQHGRS